MVICNRYLKIVLWNKLEFLIYFILSILAPITLIFCGINPTISAVLFSVFFGIGITRFFDKLKEHVGWISTLKMLLSFVKVWTEGLHTLTDVRWIGQLSWLKTQLSDGETKLLNYPSDRKKQFVCLLLMPHKFHSVDISLIYKLPNKMGNCNLFKLKHSVILVNHKIEDNLNFMLEKIHLREGLNKKEVEEITGLLKGNETSIIPVLDKELPKIECEIEKLLLILGENDKTY